jgi:DNA-binding transcriptional LysR family regulator
VTKAARELGVPQPAVSRSLARLQRDLGTPLFERVGRGVKLTAFGNAFLTHVESALASLGDGVRELRDLQAGTRGTIALGFLRTLTPSIIPNTVRFYRATHPEIDFTFHQARAAELERQLIAGDVHLCMTTQPQHTDLASQALFEQPLSIIVPAAHPLAGRASVSFSDLANEEFIAFISGHATRIRLDQLCEAAGFRPKVVLECDEAGAIRGFVAAGFGIALAIEPLNHPGIATLGLSTPGATRTIFIAWRRSGYVPTAACAFRDALLSNAVKNGSASD